MNISGTLRATLLGFERVSSLGDGETSLAPTCEEGIDFTSTEGQRKDRGAGLPLTADDDATKVANRDNIPGDGEGRCGDDDRLCFQRGGREGLFELRIELDEPDDEGPGMPEDATGISLAKQKCLSAPSKSEGGYSGTSGCM